MGKQTALITGATGGLGHEFVKVFAGNGIDLVLVGRNIKKLQTLQTSVQQEYGVTVNVIAVDFTDSEAAVNIYREVEKLNILVDYLVNNAGLGGQGTFLERSYDQDINMARVNMIVPTELMKLFLPEMVRRHSGRVLNVSSSAALIPSPLQAEYYATKAYLTSLSNAVWYELRDTGVSVTALMPGAMDTGFAKAGGLTETKMFAHGVSLARVAEEAYKAMMDGKMNVFAGLPGWQKPFVGLMPVMPKKAIMGFVASQQSVQK